LTVIPDSAVAEVLHTTELVILTLERLDELSLICASGVNCLIHAMMCNTKSLRGRIGVIDADSRVLQNLVSSPDEDHGLVEDPLLD
jgi:hypothetical protein